MTTSFSDALLRATEPHCAWGAEQLEALNNFLPEGPWTADLDTCVYRQGGRAIHISVIGTYDTAERSWLWGWANPGLRGTPAVAIAEQARQFGQTHGIPELTDELIDLSHFEDPRYAAETLAFAVMGVTGAAGYIGVDAGPTTRLYVAPDDPHVPHATPDPLALPRTLLTGAGLLGRSARSVVAGYFDHHRLPQHHEQNRISAQLPNGASVIVDLDSSDRVASVQLNTGTATVREPRNHSIGSEP